MKSVMAHSTEARKAREARAVGKLGALATPGPWNTGGHSLKQRGWGRPGTAFDPATLYRVELDFDVNATFAVWVDDVAFTR